MDERIKKLILAKIDESMSSLDEIQRLQEALSKETGSPQDFAIGLIVGRIYNSFHYQTRRILKRDATAEEFYELVQLLGTQMQRISESVKQQ